MTVKWKYCKNCHKKINEVAKKCPYCNYTSFESKPPFIYPTLVYNIKNKIIENTSTIHEPREYNFHSSKNNDLNLKYVLFYWKEDSGLYSFSKTKLFSIIFSLLVLSIFSSISIFLGVILAAFTFIISFIVGKNIHETDSEVSSKSKLNNNLNSDIIHLLLFWEDNTSNTFVLSKTKILSLLIFIFFVVYSFTTIGSIAVSFILGLFFSIPTLIIGYIIHNAIKTRSKNNAKTLPKNETNKIQKREKINKTKTLKSNKKISNDEFANYVQKINELKRLYEVKENSVRELVEKRFTSSSITTNHFLSLIDNSTKLFNNQVDVLMTIISLTDNKTPEIEEEIESRIQILKILIDKTDSLKNELILHMGISKSKDDEDIKNLLEDMENLINSVKDYD